MKFDNRFLDMHPLHNRLLVQRLDYKGKSRIIIPDIAKEPSTLAKILRVGITVKEKLLKRGVLILVPGAGAKYPDWEKEDCILITEDDIGGIVTGRDS